MISKRPSTCDKDGLNFIVNVKVIRRYYFNDLRADCQMSGEGISNVKIRIEKLFKAFILTIFTPKTTKNERKIAQNSFKTIDFNTF